MKIFSWVHRRFHHKYEEQDATKIELTGNGKKDKLALLNNEPLDSVFDGWKEGILAIGTFGIDPAALLKDLEKEEEDEAYVCDITDRNEVSTDDEDDGGYQEEDMEFPLVLKACKHGFFHDKKDDYYLPQCDEISQPNGVEDTDQMKNQKKAGERITLADLFLADSQKTCLLMNNKQLADEDHVRAKDDNNPAESINKHDSNDDRVTLISNKKLTKDHAARPIKKINRMLRKMLKKKIHPDVENQKETARTKPKRL